MNSLLHRKPKFSEQILLPLFQLGFPLFFMISNVLIWTLTFYVNCDFKIQTQTNIENVL